MYIRRLAFQGKPKNRSGREELRPAPLSMKFFVTGTSIFVPEVTLSAICSKKGQLCNLGVRGHTALHLLV